MLPDIPYPRRVCVTVLTGFLLFLISTPSLTAQGTGELMGTVTDRTGAPLAFAMVTDDQCRHWPVCCLRPQEWTVRIDLICLPAITVCRSSIPATRSSKSPDATISGPWRVVQNCTLEADAQTQGNTTAEPAQKPAPSPSNNPQEPSLEDLGITPAQAKGNAQAQALLDKRSHMLKIHQRLGLITIEPFAATLISSAFAGGRQTSSTTRDLHAASGYGDGGTVFYDGLLCHPRAQDTRHQDARAHPPAQDPGLDSRSGDGPYTHPGRDGFRAKGPRGKSPRDRLVAWAGRHRDGSGIRIGGSIRIA